AEEMHRLFKEAPEVCTRTMQFAERCNLELSKVKNPFPKFEVPEGETIDSYFEQVCRAGWKKRRETAVAHLESRGILHKSIAEDEALVERAIDCIKQMKFPGYILIVWSLISYGKEHI